jgi:hypothetical protein
MLAQGNALGFGINRLRRALKGRRMTFGHDTRGVAPGWHSPRRWRDNVAVFSSGENCHKVIY